MTQSVLFNQALTLHRQGQAAAAERLYRQILSAEPRDLQSRHMLGVLLYQQRRLAEALTATDEALRLRPDLGDIHKLRGAIFTDLGRPDDALASFAKLRALEPGNWEAWYSSGQLLSSLGRFGEAAGMLEKALAIRPSAEAWNALGAAQQQSNRTLDALASYEKAIQIDKAQPALHANRGRALQALNRLEEAVGAYDAALKLRPGDVTLIYNRAAAFLKLKRYDEAIAAADQVIALSPGHGEAWKIRASAAHKLNRFDDGLAAYDRASAINPKDLEALVGRGQILQAGQRLDEAHATLDRVLALQPDYAPAISLRGVLLCEQGRFAEGFAAHRRNAELLWNGKQTRAPNDLPQKKRHDAQQDAWRRDEALATDGLYHILGGERLAGPAVNPANAEAIAAQWKSSSPQIVVVDDLLTPQALAGLRRFCLGSTIWLRPYPNGYLGAMLYHGFACPLLAQIAEEMQSTFPDILQGHGLTMAWGFSYDSEMGGIRIHADQAAVNINFWLTPDEANNDPEHGGLIIWDKSAPDDWGIRTYNGDDDTVRAFLKETESKPITVPYRANRAVIFDSDLFHETDVIDFKDGFLNRRINVTMLFGRRTFYGI